LAGWDKAARQEFGLHWRMILAAAIGFSFTSVITAATGLFMEPISREFGWSRTLVSSGVSITAILTFLGSPLFGIFIDKWGTRRMAIPGLMLMAVVIASLSLLTGSTVQWFAIWTLYAVAALATKSTVWTAAVNSTFEAGRGLALGLVLSGAALAQAITPLLANFLIESFGWRGAFVWLGLSWGTLAVLICAVWLRDGYDIRGRARQAEGAGRTSGKAPLLDVPGLSVAEAWRSADLWRIAISTFIIMTATIALVVHQIPILGEVGVERSTAAAYAGLAGLVGIAGKLVTGALLDRYPARWVGGITIAATSLTFVLLLWPGAPTAVIVIAMMINGYAGGTKLQLVGYLTAAYTGMRKFGTIFGAMASLSAAGSGLGPVLGGWIHDTWGNYGPLLWGGFAVTLLSSVLLFGLRDYPEWKTAAGAKAS
jgi:predicted MFS family arabinose efflux permease